MQRLSSASVVATLALGVVISGCGAAYVGGAAIRSLGEGEEIDAVRQEGVTTSDLQQKEHIGLSIRGVDSKGQIIAWGWGDQGTSQPGIYEDMLLQEFIRKGVSAETVNDSVPSTPSNATLSSLEEQGFDMVLVGTMNMAVDAQQLDALTGGDPTKTGVSTCSVRGIDVPSGEVLFILTLEYDEAQDAGEVASALAESYQALLAGDIG